MFRKTILMVAVAALGLASFVSTAAAQGNRGTTIAVIDINFIFENHLRFKQAMDDIKQDIEGFDGYIRDERTKFTNKAQQLNSISADSPEYKRLEEELASQQTQLSLEMNRKRKEILDREARVFHNAYTEIQRKVSNFANQYGIDLVLRFNGTEMDPTQRESVLKGINRAVVFQRKLNITQQILDELNRQTPRIGGGPSAVPR